MQTSDLKVLTGQVIRSYEVHTVIGVGGFGIVYQAFQRSIERNVAIKVIRPQFADQPDFIRRFESEAQIVARLEHPHVVPLYDFWREPGGAFLVMRWLRGGSLRDRLMKTNTLDLATTAQLLDQVAQALSVGHEKGIVHQDIKPENILLDEYDNAYLTDFGLARASFGVNAADVDEELYGTAAYTAPEQIARRPITAQSDIYSLGMMVYELLTGGLPFASETDAETMYKQLHDPVPPIELPGIPYDVNRVLTRATAKRPEERYRDATSFAADFRRAIRMTESRRSTGTATTPATEPSVAVSGENIDTKRLFPLELTNPYKGLQAFSEADAADFFGREDLVIQLADHLRDTAERPARFLAIIGPSGSGKSSVARAGLIPQLRLDMIHGSSRWYITQMTPGAAPFEALEIALLSVALKRIPDLAERIRDPDGGLTAALKQILPDADAQCLLLIDQFEELFTLVEQEDERALFIRCLLGALDDADSRLRVIVTLRADFYDRPLAYSGLGERVRDHNEVVLPLPVEALEQVIVRPAERRGVHLEDGLLPLILEDVYRQPSALPLLQHALAELYDRREGMEMMQAAYHASGGVIGALVSSAEAIYQKLDAAGQTAARQIFLHLVMPNERSADTSRRVLRAELLAGSADKAVVNDVLDAFSKHRLLTFDHDPTTRNPTVQVAHEALIQVWDRLKGWVDTYREGLHQRQSLTAATNEWIKTKRESSFLASGSRLAQFEALLDNDTLILNDDERAYLDASIALRRRALRRVRMVIAALVAFSLVSLTLAVVAVQQQSAAVEARERADQEARVSRSRELAVVALTNQNQLDLALLLSLEAFRAADTFEARDSLLTGLQAEPHLIAYWNGQTDAVRTVAFSPDGQFVASGGRDSVILLWDAADGSILRQFSGHTGWVNAVAFSPDGSRLASASEDGTVRLWDVATGESLGEPLMGHDGAVRGVAFSPAGDVVASAGADGTVRLWDAATGEAVGNPLTGHTDAVWSVAFSPDGEQLVSGSADGTLRLWDVATGDPVGDPLTGHENWVLTVAFSPDGRTIASGGADDTVRLWDARTGEAVGSPLTGHSDWVRSVAFNADGTRLISGSADQSVRVWDVSDRDLAVQTDVYRGRAGAVWGVAFAPDGHTLASANTDRKVVIWDTDLHRMAVDRVQASEDSVMALAISPDGETLASAGQSFDVNPTIALWNVADRTSADSLPEAPNLTTSLAYSGDGKRIAAGGADGTIRLWDAASGERLKLFTVPGANTIYAVALNADGTRLAAATDQADVPLWDVESGDLLGTLSGHSDSVYSVAFSPDGRTLASGSRDLSVMRWDVARLLPLGSALIGHTDAIMSVAFSPDGGLIASGSRDGTVRLWDAASGEPYLQPLIGHTDWVTSVAFSPDSQTLASGSQDQTVRLWDVTSGQALGDAFHEHSNWVNSVAFSPDGNLLISGGQDGAIILRDVSLTAQRATACAIAHRDLTDAEWQRYFRSEPFHATCVGDDNVNDVRQTVP